MIKAFIEFQGKKYEADLNQPLDISIPLKSGNENPNAFGIQPPLFKPFEVEGFIGSVEAGGSVNCENLFMNPHGNGTHTECVGHISKEKITINQSLRNFYAVAQVISTKPMNGVINRTAIEPLFRKGVQAIVIRTLPHSDEKKTRNYSGNNPAWLQPDLCSMLASENVNHLLLDLPSVDPENDNGLLSAHHAFWTYPEKPRLDATITEMVFVDELITDGLYLLNIQIAPVESDASPSKPVLYRLQHVL